MCISVVIPIYNVEPYLPRCIDSVLQQTYTNLEIWLVDDGSQDRSGEIAEAYAIKDPRIHVIHKVNGGLSDARNVGMTQATGKYLFFLDSDDWLTSNALELLHETMLRGVADLVVGRFYYAYDDELWLEKNEGDSTIQTYNRYDGMQALIQGEKIKNFAWGKLYKRACIQDIPFPKGKLFEDIFWQHQVFDRIEKCIVISQPILYYYQRRDSIVGTFKPKNLERLEGLYVRCQFIAQHYPTLLETMHYQLVAASIESIVLLFLHRKQIQDRQYIQRIQQFIRAHYMTFAKSVQHNPQLKWSLKLINVNLYLFIAYRILEKVRRCIWHKPIEARMVQVEAIKEMVV